MKNESRCSNVPHLLEWVSILSRYAFSSLALLSGCVPVAVLEDTIASQEVPSTDELIEPTACQFDEFLEAGACSTCPHQAACCGRGYWFSQDDELCHQLPDVCRNFAAAQPDVICPGFVDDEETPLDDVPEESMQVLLRIDSIGPGSVITSPRGTPEGAAFVYDRQEFVTLTAIPNAGYIFQGWTGDISSPDNVLTISLLVDTQLTAMFGDPPFVPGHIFSFLSVTETDWFEMMVSAANNEITGWSIDEHRRNAVEVARRGLSAGGSFARQLACDTDTEAVRRRRDATWQVLGGDLGFSRFTLFTMGVANEVEAWNCQRYPDPSCALFSTCH